MKKKIVLKNNQEYRFSDLAAELIDLGYERSNGQLEAGQFSLSGGNLSIRPINHPDLIRVEFFGDFVDKVFSFDYEKGQIKEKFDQVEIQPNILRLPDGAVVRPGNYVVHDDHGIGLFSHFEVKTVEGIEYSYIVLKYLNNDTLFVPVDLVGKISPYIGVGRKRPKLNKLGSPTWKKTYKKTYENVILMAKELLQIYAKREIAKRPSWKVDKRWNDEVVKSFGYTETPDQEKTMTEVFADMQKDIPMDRLVCGDVGFGKTEIAIRTAAQACANGFQVAVLVPTTILCEQHYVTLKNRFKSLPVKIEHLSRFVSTEKQKEVVDEIKQGQVDIIVGTHRLFGEDIKFKNLGLLIIDEEQKFGVKDKEKLKKLKTTVNVLTMTATPIPRTLFMGLSGLRDISQINTPPSGRKEIKTVVEKYNEQRVRDFILQEINRKGQIYYLHNEVRTIGGVRNKIQKIFPDLKVEVAHGQMSEKVLAQAMSDFAAGKIDILVCSTIIENGLDLPNANTLIVEDSDKFGLSQLYQIRGRIGRSPRQSYALFTYRDKKITDTAFKRLKALVENSELGTGYNIALSDLEIRGGGNVLGKEQHGNMEAVGLVLYTKLLNMAVEKLKKSRTTF